jgi:hypothetical protein
MASEAIADSLFSWLDAAGNTNTLDVDVVMSTNDKRVAHLSDHVVETGAVVTDHIVLRPEVLQFELLVTQTPMGGPNMSEQALPIQVRAGTLSAARVPINIRKSQFQPGGFLLLSSGVRSVIGGLLGGGQDRPSTFEGKVSTMQVSTVQARTLQATGGDVDYVNEAFDTLVGILNTGLLVTVSFKGRLYIDYLLTSVELSQGKGDAGCGRFKVEARAFRTVSGVNVDLPDPADFRALPTQKKGNQPAKTPDPDPTKRGRSLSDRGVGGKSSAERDATATRFPGF